MTLTDELKQLADQWLAWDPNAKTRAEIQALVEAGDENELKIRLSNRIKFGTAGLRGKMQAGNAFMNDLTVLQASQGLVKAVEKALASNISGVKRGVCVGRDGRHNSEAFSKLTACAFLMSNIPVYYFPDTVPTPFVAYCVKHLNLAAGVMVTASHNPKDDNGYKVYWQNGSQIVSPVDAEIARAIDENLAPWAGISYDINKYAEVISEEDQLPLLRTDLSKVIEDYYNEVKEKCSFFGEENRTLGDSDRVVYTPMHGVGQVWIERLMDTFGLPQCIKVEQQAVPDGDFPTVPFPNPEEGKGALKLAIEKAEEHGVTLVIANDPDADRFAAAEKLPSGEWKIFTGNELGIMIGYWAWECYKNAHPDVDPASCFVLNTTVSSKLLKALADKEGLQYEETLTGFKWLGSIAQSKIEEGKTLIFCYEEAIGYLVRDVCLDKDGVRTAGLFVEMYHQLKRKHNRTLVQQLDFLYDKYGFFAANNRYFFCYDPVTLNRIFDRIRSLGGDKSRYARECGGFAIRAIRDLTVPFDDNFPDCKPVLPVSASTQMITFYFENGAIVTLRGSGTEPKLKYYCEMPGTDREETQATLDKIVQAIIHEYLQPELNNLQPPKDD